ncbi:MAG: DNA polymerase I, partial [Oscillospiraceae bacterium]|nr:DNA polymerase I [Oscillospiraceae bacterium]
LICENGSLDSVYENLDSGSLQLAPAAKQKLADGRADAYMSQNLAQICCEVPLKAEALPKRNEPNKAKLYDFCTALDLFSVIKKLNLSPAQNEQIQLDFGDDIFDMLEDLNEKKPDSSEASVRYDLLPIAELPGKFAAGALLFAELDFDSGSLYINDNFSFYKSTFGEISELFPLFSGKFDICSNHIKTIYHKFMRANIEISQESIKFDFELAGYALDPSETKYDIQSLAYKYLGLNLFDKPDFVENSIYPALYFAMMQKLKDQGLENLYYNVELPLAFVLGDMEQKGFLADIESLQKFGEELNFKAGETQEEIYRLAGTEFNINSPKQLGEVLFEKLKLPFGKKNKTGYSTNIDVMQKLKPLHPAIAPILEYRAITKLKSTYCDGLVKLSDVGGRLHTSFNQAITATGRLSSTEPNLQNIPVRTELGKNIRKFFIAEKGYMLVDADYSQIELRILAHLSGDEGLIGAFWDNRDIHRLTASQVFGVSESEVNPEMRQMAKAVNFGIIYGMSDFSLSEDIGVSVKEARAYIESYFATYPKVKIFIDETIANAKTNGYVKTMLGRIRYIPELKLSNRNLASFGERVARNTPIQGSAADIIKLAMLACHRRLAKEKLKSSLILQVHDELIFETAEDEIEIVSKLAKEEMENAYKLNVPLVADVSAGKSWHEAKK